VSDVGTFFPRSAWTSEGPARPLSGFTLSAARGLGVHHTGEDDTHGPAPTLAQTADLLESFRLDHTKRRGFSDIAYQVAVDQAGRILVLRGLSKRSAANGNPSVNVPYGAALLMIGNDELPTPQLLQGFHTFYTQAWKARTPVAAHVLLPHSRLHEIAHLGGTECPGDDVRRRIRKGTLG
jgi:hypothetical protein